MALPAPSRPRSVGAASSPPPRPRPRRAAPHGAGGAVVDRTAGGGHPPGAALQGGAAGGGRRERAVRGWGGAGRAALVPALAETSWAGTLERETRCRELSPPSALTADLPRWAVICLSGIKVKKDSAQMCERLRAQTRKR